MNKMYVSYKNWDARAKRIQNENLRLSGSSLNWVSILNHLQDAIQEVHLEDEVLLIDEEKYRQIRKELLKEYSKEAVIRQMSEDELWCLLHESQKRIGARIKDFSIVTDQTLIDVVREMKKSLENPPE